MSLVKVNLACKVVSSTWHSHWASLKQRSKHIGGTNVSCGGSAMQYIFSGLEGLEFLCKHQLKKQNQQVPRKRGAILKPGTTSCYFARDTEKWRKMRTFWTAGINSSLSQLEFSNHKCTFIAMFVEQHLKGPWERQTTAQTSAEQLPHADATIVRIILWNRK